MSTIGLCVSNVIFDVIRNIDYYIKSDSQCKTQSCSWTDVFLESFESIALENIPQFIVTPVALFVSLKNDVNFINFSSWFSLLFL